MKQITTLFAASFIALSTAQALADGLPRLDLTGASQTLNLGFATMPAWRTGTTPWPPVAQPFTSSGFKVNASLFSGLQASYSSHASSTFSPAWASLSNELEAYPNADAMTDLNINPFSVSEGVLSITASPLSAAAQATLPAGIKRTYLSGALNTYPYSQTYGYFEIDAEAPSGRGLWPAFWLLSVDDNWPPEIDAPEMLGNDPSTAYFSLHTTDKAWVATQPGGYNGSTTTDAIHSGVDGSKGFHRFGVDWGPADDHLLYRRRGGRAAHHPRRYAQAVLPDRQSRGRRERVLARAAGCHHGVPGLPAHHGHQGMAAARLRDGGGAGPLIVNRERAEADGNRTHRPFLTGRWF